MATVSTSSATQRMDMSDTSLIEFGAGLIANDSTFGWLSTTIDGEATFVDVYGSGFTYVGAGDDRELAGGSVAGVDIDLDANDTIASPELSFFGMSGPLVFDKNSAASFWNAVLAGKDVFDLSGLSADLVGAGPNIIFGDDLSAVLTSDGSFGDRAGRDVIHAGDNEFFLYGDILDVVGAGGQAARYIGGSDKLDSTTPTAHALRMFGDARQVGQDGTLKAGADRLVVKGFAGDAMIAGDAYESLSNGKVVGGDDDIRFTGVSGAEMPGIAGDVWHISIGLSQVIGGDDIISASGHAAAIAGDVYEIIPGGSGFLVGGADTITGSSFNDLLAGESVFLNFAGSPVTGGNDLIDGGSGDDIIFGEASNDGTIFAIGGLTGGDDTLSGGRGDDELYGQTGDDLITGGSGGDNLQGGDGADRVTGDEGNDSIRGGDGVDLIDGGAGSDRIIGETGADRLTGGDGRDAFAYETVADSGTTSLDRDRILDFVLGEDRVDLSFIDAIKGGGGAEDDAFAFIGAAAFSQPGQVRVEKSGHDTLVLANVEGNGGAEMSILLVGIDFRDVTAADFIP
jgi:Ca2+-binding RTX toxin-like protein